MGPRGFTIAAKVSSTGKDPEPIVITGSKARDSMPEFEVVAVAVDPAYTNYGLSAQLQQRVTEEIALKKLR